MLTAEDLDTHDDVCWECGEGGDLVCCDACPRAWHVACAGLPAVPAESEEFVCGKCDEPHTEEEDGSGSDSSGFIDDTEVWNGREGRSLYVHSCIPLPCCPSPHS